MDIKQIIRWTVAAIAIIAIQASRAETVADTIAIYRIKHDATAEMPDHLAYLSLMQNLREALRENGTGPSIAHVRKHLSIDEARARAFLAFVTSSYDAMVETNTAVTRRMLCEDDRARYETGKAYAVLDVLDDIKESNLQRKLREAMIRVGLDHELELHAWLDLIASGRSAHRWDRGREFHYDHFTVEEVVATACNAYASN